MSKINSLIVLQDLDHNFALRSGSRWCWSEAGGYHATVGR